MEAATRNAHGRGVVVGARHQMREVVPQIFHELGPVGRSGDALREGAKDDTVYRVRLHAASGHARIYRAKSRLKYGSEEEESSSDVSRLWNSSRTPPIFTMDAPAISAARRSAATRAA